MVAAMGDGMRRSVTGSRVTTWTCLTAACLVIGSCAAAPEERCATIGRAGGLLFSADNVLTIALQPEALDEDTDFCVVESERGPEIYGKAYRVYPNPKLHFAAQISYRYALPDDTSEINIGRVDADDFAEGMGRWESLDGCRVEEGSRLVSCEDDEIAKFYGLLDDYDGVVSDSAADSTGGVGPTTNASNVTTMTTAPVTDTNADTGDTNDDSSDGGNTTSSIDYPPECDDIPPPGDPIDAGHFFDNIQVGPNLFGPDDLAPDGQGGFVARSADILMRLDVTDPDNFTVAPLAAGTTFDTATIGLRYRTNGDLLMMMREAPMRLQAMHPDGTVDTLQIGFMLATRIFIDESDIAWLTDFAAGRVHRYDPVADEISTIGMVDRANGIVYDPLRQMLFVTSYGDPSSLWRIAISDSGDPVGNPVMVTGTEGYSDGLIMDVCGNLYMVDQGGVSGLGATSRLDRVIMDDDGELQDIEEIFGNLEIELASIVFGYGEAYGDLQTSVFLVGLQGNVVHVDVHVHGAPAVILDAPAG